jgi:hypothetical protein
MIARCNLDRRSQRRRLRTEVSAERLAPRPAAQPTLVQAGNFASWTRAFRVTEAEAALVFVQRDLQVTRAIPMSRRATMPSTVLRTPQHARGLSASMEEHFRAHTASTRAAWRAMLEATVRAAKSARRLRVAATRRVVPAFASSRDSAAGYTSVMLSAIGGEDGRRPRLVDQNVACRPNCVAHL